MCDCVFCKIVKGEIPGKKIYEDEDFLVFLNINPEAEMHYLAIPKIHFALLCEMDEVKASLIGKLLKLIGEKSTEWGLERGFRLQLNQKGEKGNCAHQEVMHLHFHILSGDEL